MAHSTEGQYIDVTIDQLEEKLMFLKGKKDPFTEQPYADVETFLGIGIKTSDGLTGGIKNHSHVPQDTVANVTEALMEIAGVDHPEDLLGQSMSVWIAPGKDNKIPDAIGHPTEDKWIKAWQELKRDEKITIEDDPAKCISTDRSGKKDHPLIAQHRSGGRT